MITQDQATQLVYAKINAADPDWKDKPEMIIVKIKDHALGWVIYYTSKPWHETKDFKYAIAGNAPYLVSRDDGTLWSTGTRPPIEDRILEAERKLRMHLESKAKETQH